MIYLDTHVAMWLASGDLDHLSRKAKLLIESEPMRISGAVVLEIALLRETGRFAYSAVEAVQTLAAGGVKVCDIGLDKIGIAGADLSFTRDPFDRLIVANCVAAGAGLLTRDRNLRKYFSGAVW